MKEITEQRHSTNIQRAVELMRRDPGANLSIARLATEACMARSHFLQVFSGVTSVSPHRFLAALRMERAKTELLETNRDITAICLNAGYTSLGTFTRIFSNMVGISPSKFRLLRDGLISATVDEYCGKFFSTMVPEEHGKDVVGTVVGPADFCGVLFLGIFPSAIPQSLPKAGAFMPTLGRFCFKSQNVGGESRILALALKTPANATDLLNIRQQSVLVAGAALPSCQSTGRQIALNMTLRELTLFDPPLVLTLPPPQLSRNIYD